MSAEFLNTQLCPGESARVCLELSAESKMAAAIRDSLDRSFLSDVLYIQMYVFEYQKFISGHKNGVKMRKKHSISQFNILGNITSYSVLRDLKMNMLGFWCMVVRTYYGIHLIIQEVCMTSMLERIWRPPEFTLEPLSIITSHLISFILP